MNPEQFIDDREAYIQVVIVSQVCLFRECLSQSLADDKTIHILDACATLDHALDSVKRLNPDLVLLDAKFAGGARASARLNEASRRAQIVAMALEESEENILDWAEGGIAGYVADTASMRDLPRLLRQIRWGRQACSSQVMGGLLRRIGRMGREIESRRAAPAGILTPREQMIQQHIAAGLSNKDIARRLNISVGTAKTHVHNILGKLKLSNRAQVAARHGGRRASIEG
jgi:DNA-binding NarL/FixJ family response regulator